MGPTAHDPRSTASTLVLHLLVGTALAACSRSDGPIRIACPLTLEHEHGAMLAVEELNRTNGIHGRMLELVGADALSGSTLSVASAIATVGSFAFAMGHLGSHDTIVGGKIYEDAQVLMLVPNATNPQVHAGPCSFSMSLDNGDEAAFLVQQAIERLAASRIVILYENNDYGRDLARSLECDFERRNLEPLRIMNHASHEVFPAIITAACDLNPDLILCASQVGPAAQVQRHVAALGLPIKVLGGDALDQRRELRRFPEARGLLMARLFTAADAPRLAEFEQRYRQRFAEEPESHAALAHDAVLAGAIAMRHGATTAQGIARTLVRFGHDLDAPAGVTGPIVFDKSRKRSGIHFELAMFNGTDIEPWRSSP